MMDYTPRHSHFQLMVIEISIILMVKITSYIVLATIIRDVKTLLLFKSSPNEQEAGFTNKLRRGGIPGRCVPQ